MRIKMLALANSDCYEDVICKDDLIQCITNKELIKISIGKQEIFINSEFVVSFEI